MQFYAAISSPINIYLRQRNFLNEKFPESVLLMTQLIKLSRSGIQFNVNTAESLRIFIFTLKTVFQIISKITWIFYKNVLF